MKIHTCALFDLDGVIVDTANYHFLAWRKIASNFGFEFEFQIYTYIFLEYRMCESTR